MKDCRLLRVGWRVLILCLMALAPVGATPGPEMVVRPVRGGGEQRLAIAKVKVDVVFFEDMAATSLTISFQSHHSRVLEGEFSMPLPEGATVSEYALEVSGAMRAGVAVEKEKAENAYESIKRMMIDPGFVSREEGNVYRTKIFPIPANGTKAVQVGYLQMLDVVDGRLQYELPMGYPVEIAKMQVDLREAGGGNLVILDDADLTVAREARGLWSCAMTKVNTGEKLVVGLAVPEEARVVREDLGTMFYVRDEFPEELREPRRRKVEELTVAWDCSESARSRDRKRELDLLGDLLREWKEVKVRLELVHLEVEEAGEFMVRGGEWGDLRSVLEGVLYDGASNLAALKPKGDLTLVFTDGVDTAGGDWQEWEVPVCVVGGGSEANVSLRRKAERSGGALVELEGMRNAKVVQRLVEMPVRLLEVRGDVVQDYLEVAAVEEGVPVRVFGRLNKNASEGIELCYGRGGKVEVTKFVAAKKVEGARLATMLRRGWAQEWLRNLEGETVPNRAAIVEHCKEHGLVSDYTSLIVLERFQDHVRYEIPPPEPELRKQYDEAMRVKKDDVVNWRTVEGRWEKRQQWHAKDYPWLDHMLEPRLRRVRIWRRALGVVFEKEDLDLEALEKVTDWEKAVGKVREERGELGSGKEYERWFKDVHRLVEEEQTLTSIEVALPQAGDPVAVSVRGFVKTPQKVVGKGPLTLSKALEEAGGVHMLGTKSGVAVYRSAGKTIYNMLSEQYEDVVLRPGDMVVVMQEGWDYWRHGWDSDPFAAGPPKVADPRKDPAVIQMPPSNPGSPVFRNSLGGGGASDDPFGGTAPKEVSLTGEVKVVAVPGEQTWELKEFREALKAGGDAKALYAAQRDGFRYPDSFYLEVAALLRERGEKALGRRVLSNLVEERDVDASRYRRWAMLLGKHEEWDRAAIVLEGAAERDPDGEMVALDQAWVAVHRGKVGEAVKHLRRVIVPGRNTPFVRRVASEMAAAELTTLEGGAESLTGVKLGAVLPADIRVVVIGDGEVPIQVVIKEPGGGTGLGMGRVSVCGGRMISANAIAEYMMRDAMPGTYTVTCRSREPVVVRMQLYQNWGRENETCVEKVVALPGGHDAVTLAEYGMTIAE